MTQIARVPQRAFQAPNMIDLVTKLVLGVQRALGTLGTAMIHQSLHPLGTQLLRVVAVLPAGELVLVRLPPRRRRGVRMSLPTTMAVTMRTATRIVVNASLLPATLPMAGGAAEAQAALAEAPVVQAALAAPTVEVATCLGTNMTSIGR